MTQQKQRSIARFLAALAGALILVTAVLLLLPTAHAAVRAEPVSFEALPDSARLDLNNATAEELESLPGIGPVTAGAILTRRAELGGFHTREDVLSVPGLGEKTYDAIAPFITYK